MLLVSFSGGKRLLKSCTVFSGFGSGLLAGAGQSVNVSDSDSEGFVLSLETKSCPSFNRGLLFLDGFDGKLVV